VNDIKSHAFFRGLDWQNLYLQPAAYQPVVTDELDTQNFESFDEDTNMTPIAGSSSRRKKDLNFLGCVGVVVGAELLC
jgi:serine/threonine kinase 38